MTTKVGGVKTKRAYRLTFGGTRKKLYSPTLAVAMKDARYWVNFGQMKVCIDRMLPSGGVHRVKCITRR